MFIYLSLKINECNQGVKDVCLRDELSVVLEQWMDLNR